MSETDVFIEAALAAVDEAGAVIRRYFHTKVAAERKQDLSPIVTEADRAAERVLRAQLRAAFPGHAIFGEEDGYEPGQEPYEWILDPIDGTIAFSCGKPVFATLVALCREGTPILGVIDQPITGHRWVGAAGRTTLFNGKPCRTSDKTGLSDARFSTTAPEMFADGLEGTLSLLRERCWVTSYGGDAYAYGLLASGHIEVIIERGLSRHDIAALVPVVAGAGGTLTDLSGNPVSNISAHTDDRMYDACATANPQITDQVSAILASA